MNISEDRLYKELGRRLRDYRKGRFTQEALADKIGLERTSITNIERGAQKVPLHTLYRICNALSIDVRAVLPDVESVIEASQSTEQVRLGGQVVTLPPMAAQAVAAIVGDTP